MTASLTSQHRSCLHPFVRLDLDGHHGALRPRWSLPQLPGTRNKQSPSPLESSYLMSQVTLPSKVFLNRKLGLNVTTLDYNDQLNISAIWTSSRPVRCRHHRRRDRHGHVPQRGV
jgi:hypothetical protein